MEINGSDSISNKIPATNGTVAQEVEQGTENPRVGGSTPPRPTTNYPGNNKCKMGSRGAAVKGHGVKTQMVRIHQLFYLQVTLSRNSRRERRPRVI